MYIDEASKNTFNKYTNTANGISLDMYLTLLEMERKHGIEIHKATSLSFQPYTNAQLVLSLDIPSFSFRINPEMDLLLQKMTDKTFAEQMRTQHQSVLDRYKSNTTVAPLS